MYKYNLYGLKLLSDIELNCYKAEFDQEDVRVFSENDPEKAYTLAKTFTVGSAPVTISSYSDIGRIYICDNYKIVYSQQTAIPDNMLMTYLLGFVLAYVLMCRDIFVLHGSAVSFDGRGLILVGNPGAGKSTLSSGFVHVGGKIVSDDISRVELNNGKPFVYPGCPALKLWKESAEHLEFNIKDANKLSKSLDKYIVDDTEIFSNKSVDITSIVRIFPSGTHEVELIKESPTTSLKILLNNTYCLDYILGSEYLDDFYDFIIDLCNQVPVYTLYRPQKGFSVNAQIEIIKYKILQI